MTTSLRVHCSDSELAEDGIVLAVRDRVERVATPHVGLRLGTDLAAVPWAFDQ